MRKGILYIALGAALFTYSCDTKVSEQKSDENIEASEKTMEEEKEEMMEKEAMKSDQFADNPEGFFGEIISPDGALKVEEFSDAMEGKDTIRTKIRAVAESVCKNKGCWMKVRTADGDLMRIKFKDYAFFVPMDIDGKEVVFEGVAFRDTTSVEDLKHYAKDGGQSDEEIAAITEPEISTSFLADGVMIVQ